MGTSIERVDWTIILKSEEVTLEEIERLLELGQRFTIVQSLNGMDELDDTEVCW